MAGLPPRHRAAARTRADGGLHHDADQRPQGLRHRHLDRTRLGSGRRDRDGAADVAHRLQRLERLRRRLRHRRPHLPVRDPDPADQHPPLPKGGIEMATAEAEVGRVPAEVEEGWGAKILRFLSKAPVHVLLVFVGLLWLIPTFGLLITSLLSPADFIQEGWWQVFSDPGKLTWENYDAVLHN